jgi:hypothetical protein
LSDLLVSRISRPAISHAGATVSVSQLEAPHIWLAIFAAAGGHPASTNGDAGNVQVIAQGSSYTHCCLFEYNGATFSPEAAVACLNNSGNVVSSKHTIQWAVS